MPSSSSGKSLAFSSSEEVSQSWAVEMAEPSLVFYIEDASFSLTFIQSFIKMEISKNIHFPFSLYGK